VTQQFLRQNIPDFIAADGWASYSPDLNPLNYCIWDILQDLAYEGQRLPFASLQDLKEAIKNKWKEVTIETVRKSTVISFCLNSIVEQYNIIAKFETFFMSHPVFLHQERWAIMLQLLQIYFSICVPKIIKIQCGSIKLLQKQKGCNIFAPQCTRSLLNISTPDMPLDNYNRQVSQFFRFLFSYCISVSHFSVSLSSVSLLS